MLPTCKSSLFLLATAALALSGSSAIAEDDPFLWLEAPTSQAALDWAKQQTDQTRKELSASASYAAVSAELKQSLGKSPPPPMIALAGPRALRVSRDLAHPHGRLEVADRGPDGVPGPWRTVLDMGELRAREGKPYVLQYFYLDTRCAPPDYDRCLLGLSLAGADDGELREFDLKTGKFVADGFRAPTGRSSFTWLDRDTVLISSTAFSGVRTDSGFSAAVHLWKRGTSPSAAREIWHGEPTDKLIQMSSVGASGRRRGVIQRVVDFSTFKSYVVSPGEPAQPVELPFRVTWSLGATQRHLIFQTTEPAVIAGVSVPANSIVAYDTGPATAADHRLSIVYAPRPGEIVLGDASIPQVATTQSAVHFVVIRHLVQRPVTAKFNKDQWALVQGDPSPVGTTVGYGAADKASDDLVTVTTGFVVPKRYDYVRAGARVANLYQGQPLFDASKHVVEARTATSSDGTPIDYFLLRPKQITRPGATPTLITGYGGFAVTFMPDYLGPSVGGGSLTTWLARGGALALASIRGGGDQGAAWHRAATGINRQRAFDDFLAVTADLERKFTSPEHVGVFGSSNGGLLAATVAIQRPDMFGAVVSDVPLTDMLRFPEMGVGKIWFDEFGDPKDPAVAAAIVRYSPYQNVRKGVKYPPVMITSSTQDNRVGPGHARKLAARLGAVGSRVYLYEDGEGGHGVSDPLQRPEIMSLRMAFFIDQLMTPSNK